MAVWLIRVLLLVLWLLETRRRHCRLLLSSPCSSLGPSTTGSYGGKQQGRNLGGRAWGPGRGLGSAVSWGARRTQVWWDRGNPVPEAPGEIPQATLEQTRCTCATAESPLVLTPGGSEKLGLLGAGGGEGSGLRPLTWSRFGAHQPCVCLFNLSMTA